MSNKFLLKVKKAICGVNCEASLSEQTEKFVSRCEEIASFHFHKPNGIVSEQVASVVAATAIEYDNVLKELDEIKQDISSIREKITK